MKKCQYCQAEVLESAQFCNHCGKNLVNEEVGASEELQTDAEQLKEVEPVANVKVQEVVKENKKSNKQPKKNSKVILISSVAIILLLIGGYIFGNYQTSVDHLLKDFEAAVQAKDTKKLADILTADHKELKVNAESLEGLIQLYESQPSELTSLLNNLHFQASEGNGLAKMFPIDLMKDGKKYLFFDNYSLVLNSVYIKVNTNYKDTDIIVNGEVVATTDSDDFMGEVGPLLPGEYTVEASYDTGFFHLKSEAKVKAIDPGFPQYVDLYLEGKNIMFNISSNRYDKLKSIKLFINGKDTGWDLAKDDKVGPLLTDGSMNASFEAEFPWGKVRTNDVPIDDTYFDFNLGNSKEFQEEVMKRIILYNEELLDVYANADPDKMTTVTDRFLEDVTDEILLSVVSDLDYQGSFHGVDFYTDSFILKQDYDGMWTVEVDTITYLEESFHDKGKKAKVEKVEEEVKYKLSYNPKLKDWIIFETDSSGYMDEDKMERHKVKDPTIYKSDWDSVRKDIDKELDKLK